MTVREPELSLEDHAVAGLVSEWAGADRAEQLTTWNSRTAHLTLWDAHGARLLVKQVESPKAAERLHETLEAFADVAPPGVRRLRPLGWARRPPCVCMPYIAAPSLATLVNRQWLRWDAPALEVVVERVGAALAAFHSLTRTADGSARAEADQALSLVLEHVAPEVHDSLYETAKLSLPVRVYDDINPSHILVQTDVITLIDVPAGAKFTHPHRDLAWFADKLLMTLLRAVPRVPASLHLAGFVGLRDRLLRSYFEATGSPLTAGDRDLVAAFQARYLSRRERSLRRSFVASSFFRVLRLRTSRRLRLTRYVTSRSA